jgi:hypothetical protein
MKFPKHLNWEACPCGHPSCKRRFPNNLGSFAVGTGFEPEEVNELDRRWELGNET